MTEKFNPQDFEKDIQKQWEDNNVYQTPSGKSDSKKYILDAFAYPSGKGLHAGHAEGYTGTDIVARFYRMKGFDVLYPVGWDAFGLPAENYAIKTGVHPRENTDTTIGYYQQQVRSLGLSNDWNDEIASHNPEYYKWTQWFFSFLYRQGLAYKKEAMVNWDPVDQTVLANEQVLPDGTAERSGAKVEQRMLSQWFFKITDYAERLLQDLDTVDWPESTKQQQRNWIGKSEGAIVHWDIADCAYPEFIQEGADKEGANPVRERGVALIRIKESGQYIVYTYSGSEYLTLPGGLIEENENPYQAAVREAEEEVGVTGLHLINKIGTCHNYVPYESDTAHYLEHYYLFEISEEDFVNRKDGEVDDTNSKYYGDVGTADEEGLRGNNWNQLNWVLDNLDTPNQFQISTFTTRIDTIYSGTYLILGPEHPLVQTITIPEQFDEVNQYVEKTKRMSNLERTELNKEKTGVFTGSYAINPATGEKIQVWISDFVIGTYGTGAVFADAHDLRDFELAKKYDIPLKTSIKPKDTEDDSAIRNLEECFEGYGILYNSGEFDGMTSEEAKVKIAEYGATLGWAQIQTNYKLRDWLVSRQRYWGSPIPIVYDTDGNEILVEDKDLPVILPDDVEFAPTGKSPLYDHKGFHASAAEKYGEGARREVDTMDTFVCSSWYMFRFCDPANSNEFAGKESLKRWMPIDEYVIGAEHTVLHLLYARFFTKVLFDAGYIDFDEPFMSLRHPGMIQGEDGRKMSKRWGNVINPIDVVEEYGADTLRMYEMFMGPFDQAKSWNTQAIKGVRRFLDRVWAMQDLVGNDTTEEQEIIESALHALIKKAEHDIPKFAFNTTIAEFMKFANLVDEVHKQLVEGVQQQLQDSDEEEEERDEIEIEIEGDIMGQVFQLIKQNSEEDPEAFKKTIKVFTPNQWNMLLRTLAPFAPFVTEKLWNGDEKITQDTSIHRQQWPSYDESKIASQGVVIGIQVSGKVRSEILVTESDDKDSVRERVMQDEVIQKWIEGKPIRKFIYVPNKIVNILV
jgi:leucyl-tRNA synthetase